MPVTRRTGQAPTMTRTLGTPDSRPAATAAGTSNPRGPGGMDTDMDTRMRLLLVLDVLLKVALVAAIAYAASHTDLARFHDKAMGLRAVVYPMAALLIPAAWWLFGRGRIAYPVAIDIAVVIPFLSDTLGNLFDLYDSITWFDDALHFLNWIPWVVAFGLALRYLPLGRLNVAALTVGFGAVTNILWEIGEYAAFITGNQQEMQGIYRDTVGDLALSLLGSVVGAVLVATVLWRLVPQRRRSPAG
jgi:glycopeptide antibiotics resistance protein